MLGIVIGISSVILLMSIGTSAQRMIIDQVEGIGSNLVFVIPGGTPKNSKSSPPASILGIVIKTLNEKDLEDFRREPSINNVAADNHGQARVVYGSNDVSATYSGVTGDYFNIINLKVGKGNPITRNDDKALNKVTVLGPEIAKTLFGSVDPIGKSIRMKGLSFRVTGVLDEKGLGVFGADLDNMVFIPMSVSQKQLLGTNYYRSMTVEAKSEYTIEFVKSRMTSILRQNHNITDPDKDDFTIRTQEDVLSLLGNITSILKIFLTSIAAISLVVGGIGIMNIMLVSVIERTREIGLRKALGATNNDILQQFLTEAIII
ncbi:MAG: ABC transporter permease, partial [Patescibacteria group bacterium]